MKRSDLRGAAAGLLVEVLVVAVLVTAGIAFTHLIFLVH